MCLPLGLPFLCLFATHLRHCANQCSQVLGRDSTLKTASNDLLVAERWAEYEAKEAKKWAQAEVKEVKQLGVTGVVNKASKMVRDEVMVLRDEVMALKPALQRLRQRYGNVGAVPEAHAPKKSTTLEGDDGDGGTGG